MASKSIALLAVAALVLVAQAAPPAAERPVGVTFIAANIVKNATKDCPVKNELFTKEEFDADRVLDLATTLQEQGTSQKCMDAAIEHLASCATDGSLTIKKGCCSQDCSKGIKTSVSSGCFTEYAKAICNDPKAGGMMTGLLNAGMRCADFTTTCEKVLGSAVKAGNTTAAANATKAAAAPLAEAQAAPAPKRSSAVSSAVAAAVPLAAAAAALLL